MNNNVIKSIASVEQDSFPDPWSYDSIVDVASKDYYIILIAYMDANEQTGILTVNCGPEAISFLEESWQELGNPVMSGYAIVNLMGSESELLRIAVEKDFRGKHIASELMKFYMTDVIAESYYLEVRFSNLIAINLYKKFGYENVGTRKDYYKNPTEDAYIFKKVDCL